MPIIEIMRQSSISATEVPSQAIPDIVIDSNQVPAAEGQASHLSHDPDGKKAPIEKIIIPFGC